jgi:phosphoribosyl-ATP pyrophosphohydrolase
MIVPSIDLMKGHAVQLVGGKEMAIDAGEPMAVAERFSVAGELAVIDLDAALGRGSNRELIQRLVRRFRCRVGGGIRTVDAALDWLDAGAEQVILGTAATPELLRQLPRERVIAAVDSVDSRVVVEGWQVETKRRLPDRVAELQDLVGGFLVTFVEREGRLEGTDLERARAVVQGAGRARVTVAGGVSTVDEIAEIDAIGADAQVGMALYNGQLPLADAIAAPLTSDRPDRLWPTVVCDEDGRALGLAYSSLESLRDAVDRRRGIYQSRSRGLWVKGETSGDVQELLEVRPDCDRDALRFTVRQHGRGFCHRGTWTCWGPTSGLEALERRLAERLSSEDAQSYSRSVVRDPGRLGSKLDEEAEELGRARQHADVVWEAADLLYFTALKLASSGVAWREVLRELERRDRVTRRRDGSRKYSSESSSDTMGGGQ